MIKAPPTFDEIATFIVALVILAGSFWGLLVVGGTNDVRVVYGALIGGVMTYFFQRGATKAATAHTIEAQNNGLETIRRTVGRMEAGRIPTQDEVADRDREHKA